MKVGVLFVLELLPVVTILLDVLLVLFDLNHQDLVIGGQFIAGFLKPLIFIADALILAWRVYFIDYYMQLSPAVP